MSENTNTLKLELSSTPHIHSFWDTQKAMWMVVLSLVPPLISGAIFFGPYQLLVVLTSVVFCIGTEYVIRYLRKKPITIMDGSAFITGILLGLILPPNFSLVFTAIGAVIAIGLGKEIFGGLGYNIFNPALIGRAFLQAAFPVQMTTWTHTNFAVDAVTSATPLSIFKFGDAAAKSGVTLSNSFFGNISGSIGETSAIAILAAGIFLIAIKIVNWRTPLAMVISLFVFSGIFYFMDPSKYPSPLLMLFTGGFMFGAVYMATDWVTSPMTNKGMWIYGAGISLIVVVIRLFGGLPEGVMYAILIMNGFVPLINRNTKPVIFGEAK
ncbi:MAG: RnfABCDGE type electron transport complex subunit D [Ignavibacteriaceae bacterium]|nr:RnfABCDGE type electron transport complex subunit D [Ignavibacteriaceae bacterium]